VKPVYDNCDLAILQEKIWLSTFPQGEEWRDLNDRIIDSREFNDSFKQKLKYAEQYERYLQANVKSGIYGITTIYETQEKISVDIGRDFLHTVIDEIIRSFIEEMLASSSLKNRSMDLLSKIILNGILDINEKNKRYLKQTGKIALLRGSIADITLDKNNTFEEQKDNSQKLFQSLITTKIDDLTVVKNNTSVTRLQAIKRLKEEIQRKRKKLESIFLYNASYCIDQHLVQNNANSELKYWETVSFIPMPTFNYDKSKYGMITVIRLYQNASLVNEDEKQLEKAGGKLKEGQGEGSILVACTSAGRILSWKISYRETAATTINYCHYNNNEQQQSNTFIELLATNNKQKDKKDKIEIIDFKIPISQPNTIITMNKDHILTVWNLKFIFNEMKLQKERNKRREEEELLAKNNKWNFFNCFSSFFDKNKYEIIIEKVLSLNHDDLCYQRYVTIQDLSLYESPSNDLSSFQRLFEKWNSKEKKPVEIQDILGLPASFLSSTSVEYRKRQSHSKDDNGNNNNNLLIDRRFPTAFSHFHSIGLREGEPESMLIGTNDGAIFKINLDLVLSQFVDNMNSNDHHLIHHQHKIREGETVEQKRKRENQIKFVDKEYVNPLVAPEGFILDTVNKKEDGENDGKRSKSASSSNNSNSYENRNQVFREIFRFHEFPIILLEVIHENQGEKERIISMDSEGIIAIWNYSSKYFQGSCWFIPEITKKLSLEIIDFISQTESSIQEPLLLELSNDFPINELICISVDKPLPSSSSSLLDNSQEELSSNSNNDGLISLQIDSSRLYYPVYDETSDHWIQYEILEGSFKKIIKSRRISSIVKVSPRKSLLPSEALLSVDKDTARQDGTQGEEEKKKDETSSHSVEQIRKSLDVSSTSSPFASKVVEKLRNSIFLNQQLILSKAMKKHFVQPIITKMQIKKSIVSGDGLDLILLLEPFLPSKNNDTSKNNRGKGKNVTSLELYLYLISLKHLTCRFPTCKIILLKDEQFRDMIISSLISEIKGRYIHLLTNRRILIYSLLTGNEISTHLITKPWLSIQRIEQDFHISSSGTSFIEKISVCPSNKFLIVTSSKKPFLCLYRVDCSYIEKEDPFARYQVPSASLPEAPWSYSLEELDLFAIKTIKSTSNTFGTSESSILDEVHDYAVGLCLDAMIKKLEEAHEEFTKSVVEDFFQNNLGFIKPVIWPNLEVKRKRDDDSSSSSSAASTPTKLLSGNNSTKSIKALDAVTSSKGTGSELLDESLAKELKGMILEDIYQHELLVQEKELKLMKQQDK
jgi:hypothetical protein